MKNSLKEKAISLRKNGLSYSEIIKQVPVAKSTLAVWLQSVGLSNKQIQRITQKRIDAGLRGAQKRHQLRIEQTKNIKQLAREEAKELINNKLWIVGTVLYWGEGEKEKERRPSGRVSFSNMDVKAHKMFLKWSDTFLKVSRDLFTYSIFIHEQANISKAINFWSRELDIKKSKIDVYLKRNNPKTNRENTGEKYNGVFMIRIHKSTALNRRIAGWIEYVIESFL